MTDVKYAGLVLEDQLLDHLATQDGAMAIWRERLDPDIIGDQDRDIRNALIFVQDYINEYGIAPTRAVFSAETGYEEFKIPEAPVEYIVDSLKERELRKKLTASLKGLARSATVDPKGTLRRGYHDFTQMISESATHRNELDTNNMSLVVDRYFQRGSVETPTVTFGFDEVDKQLAGLRKGELYFIVARPKRFKSFMMLKSAVESFLKGNNVYLDTLEMPPEEMQDRALCMLTGVSYTRFQHAALMPADMLAIDQIKEWLTEQPNWLRFRKPPITERTIPHMHQVAKDAGADVLYIDQLSWIQSTIKTSADQRHREVGYICEAAKEASVDFPVFIAAQFNRETMAVKSFWDLDLATIGLSDSIGQIADTVFGVYASKEMINSKLFHWGVIESRHFETCAWEVKNEIGLNTNFRIIDELDPEEAE